MRHILALALTLFALLPGQSHADPVTAGAWSPAPLADNDEFGFYDGLSWDCAACNVGFKLKGAIEYLHDGAHRPVGFGYRAFAGAALISRTTDWTGGVLSWDGNSGSFMYSTGTGYFYNSWQGSNMVLFRIVEAAATTYFLGIEDIPIGWGREDRDFNDSVYSWNVASAGPLPPPPTSPPAPVPEPGAWALALTGLTMALGWRARRSS